MVTRCHLKPLRSPLRGPRPRRRSRDHLRLPEHPRLRRWFPDREHLPTFDGALTWFVDRGVIHQEGARRGARRSRGRRVAAPRPRARPYRPRGPARGRRLGRRAPRGQTDALTDGQPGAPRAPGHRARAVARRRQRRPSSRRRPGRRRAGAPGRAARSRADRRSPRPHPDLRQRHLPLGLLRHVAHGPPALVRHGDLRQPGQGGAPSGAASGEERAEPRTRPSSARRSPSADRRSRIGRTSVAKRVIDSSSCGDGKPAMRWR